MSDPESPEVTPDPWRAAHEHRMSWMPWLYDHLKPRQAAWARPWQEALQARLAATETITFGTDVFVSPDAHLFAEPGRRLVVGDGVRIAAEAFLHGPITLGAHVSVQARCHLDGGARGIVIGDHTRIAAGARLFAFDHRLDPSRPVRTQGVRSQGLVVGCDVWIGAGAGITDGVVVGDHAVIGLGAVVTRDVPAWAVVGGVPARVLGDRRDWPADPRPPARPRPVATPPRGPEGMRTG